MCVCVCVCVCLFVCVCVCVCLFVCVWCVCVCVCMCICILKKLKAIIPEALKIQISRYLGCPNCVDTREVPLKLPPYSLAILSGHSIMNEIIHNCSKYLKTDTQIVSQGSSPSEFLHQLVSCSDPSFVSRPSCVCRLQYEIVCSEAAARTT